MSFQLSVSAVASLKHDLRVAFPLYRSSHLHEALAYGFGYRTSAALQAALKGHAGAILDAKFDPWRMHQRLSEIGYLVDPAEFEHAFVSAVPDAAALFSEGPVVQSDSLASEEAHEGRPIFESNGSLIWHRRPSMSRDIEGAYRRAYHQAIANAAYAMIGGRLTAERLLEWVEGPGMKWRKDGDLAFRELPPPL